MKVSTLNGVKIYELSAGKSLPEFMEEAKNSTVTSAKKNLHSTMV